MTSYQSGYLEGAKEMKEKAAEVAGAYMRLLLSQHPAVAKTNGLLAAEADGDLAEQIRSLLPEGSEGWRSDMENAPRDRAILVWRKSQLMVARWDDDHYANKPRPFWNCLSVWGKRDERDEPPTHWRPMLPSPPTGKGE